MSVRPKERRPIERIGLAMRCRIECERWDPFGQRVWSGFGSTKFVQSWTLPTWLATSL